MRIAEVLIPRPVFQSYTYKIPDFLEKQVFSGMRVQVPFGPQKIIGIIRATGVCTEETRDLKELEGVFEDVSFLSEKRSALIDWMSSYYLVPKGEIASLFYPRYFPPLRKVYAFARPVQEILGEISSRRKKLKGCLERVLEPDFPGIFTKDEIIESSGLSPALFRDLVQKGFIMQEYRLLECPASENSCTPNGDLFPALSPQQSEALRGIQNNSEGVSYLFGVTGSGKTEVYLNLVRQSVEKGRGVIFLVPEISLTPQMIQVFDQRFPGSVAVHHSHMTEREKYRNWLSVLSGEKRIMIGARSALFAPVRDLGLIIIDEEGENSYKQDTTPAYDARRVALEMSRIYQVPLVMGSATPSLFSWNQIQSRGFQVFEMPGRHNQKSLPKVRLVDLKEEYKQRNFSIFSTELKENLQRELQKGNQAILFVNRRGHSSFVMCRKCGSVLECRNCKVSLTYHDSKKLHCHYCSYSSEVPSSCPECHSTAIKFFGLGTQKVEAFFQKEFPGIPYARLDTDLTRKKGYLESVLQKMEKKEIQVLIGTQMISKGLDFQDVTLIGVLNPDSLVRMGDYSASERAFQLFVQIAGRSGRSEKKGEVLLQTYAPDREIYQRVMDYDLKGFLKDELFIRKALNFPPYATLVHIQSSSKEPLRAREALIQFYEKLKQELPESLYFELHEPQKSPIERIEGRFRYRCILKAPQSQELWDKLFELRANHRAPRNTRLKIIVDADNLL